MNQLAKKRAKAILIDTAVSTGVSVLMESLLRKKMKNDFFYVAVLPTLTLWGLECVQIKANGQTAGQKMMDIKVVSDKGGELSSGQILKRAVHRDSISPFSFLINRAHYAMYKGAKYPHDIYADTKVVEE